MFNQDESMLRYGVTALDNLFIMEYLPAARGDYVKVYLYALFLSTHPREGMSVAEMAADLSMPVTEVENALRYWERRRLISRVSDNPPAYRVYSAAQLSAQGKLTMEVDNEFVAFSEAVYALFGDRRKVTPAEISLAYEWVLDPGLPQETVLMLLAYCIATRGVQFSFKAAQPEAMRMHEAGVVSAEDAEVFFAHNRKVHDGTRAVLRRLGKRRQPSQDEMNLYAKWTDEWKYTSEAILEACSETTKGEPTMAYLDGILNGIRTRAAKAGAAVSTGKDILAQMESEKNERGDVLRFAKALGMYGSTDALKTTYQRFCQTHAPELVLFAAEQTYLSHGDVQMVEKYLESFQRQGITSRRDAEAFVRDFHETNKLLYRVFEACGHQGKPTKADRTLYKKWQSMGFSEEMILLAAVQSLHAETKPPYIDKVLEAWHTAGVTDPAQVAARKAPARPAAAMQKPARQVSAQQYTQRDYTEAELANELTNELLEEARRNHE